MTYSEKIEDWIKEAETRPSSALMILKLVAGRLRELTERNEELLAENISLQDGSRVEEYEKRISYLEYQLDLLKRGTNPSELSAAEISVITEPPSLLIYNAEGKILRVRFNPDLENYGQTLGRLEGGLNPEGEPPRMLCVPDSEEVLLLFSSGRIGTLAINTLKGLDISSAWKWEHASVPDEPHAGEELACLMPISRLPVSDYLLQVSRRGWVKKTLTNISEKIISGHYLGRGATQKGDQPLDAFLGQKKSKMVIVTYEGRVLGLDVDGLSYSAEERLHLHALDHVVAGFTLGAGETLTCITQTGKVIQRDWKSLDIGKAPSARGQGLISPARLEQGVRFIGALRAQDDDWFAALDAKGNISLHKLSEASSAGSIQRENLCLSVVPVAAALLIGTGK